MRLSAWALAVAAAVVVQVAAKKKKEEEELNYPACRKSLELHALRVPTSETSQGGKPSLFFFGGKGYIWEEESFGGKGKGKGKGGKGGKEGDDEHVQFFGMEDMWQFDLNGSLWRDMPLAGGPDSAPPQRWKFSTSTFDGDSRLALFGGCASTNIRDVLDDLWVYEVSCCPTSGRWRRVQAAGTPAARRGHVVAANSTHLLVFGGKTFVKGEGPKVLTDLWALPLEALRGGEGGGEWRWTQGASFPDEPRWGSTGSILKDPNGHEVLAVFGGRVWSGAGYTYFNDLWLYNCTSNIWQHQAPPEPAPHARDHHGAAALSGDLFVFGGRVAPTRAADSVLGDVWSFSLRTGRWSEHPRGWGLHPGPRFMPGVASVQFDGEEGLAVAGGELLPGSTKQTTLNDVWIYLPRRGGGWRLLSPAWCGPEDFPRYALPGFLAALGLDPTAVIGLCLAASIAALAALGAAAATVWHRRRGAGGEGGEGGEGGATYQAMD